MTFVKGQSGNPGGRPKTKPLTALILKELDKKAPGTKFRQGELAVWKLVQLAIAGEGWAIKEILDRVEGKAVQPLEHSGADGTGLEFTIQIARPPIEADDARDA